jgi:TonB family protein
VTRQLDGIPRKDVDSRPKNLGGSMLKSFCAVAAIVLWGSASLNHVTANDLPSSSGPTVSSCSVGEPINGSPLKPDVLIAASRAVFMKLCRQQDGALVYGDDARLIPNLKQPEDLIGPSPFRPDQMSPGPGGRVFISYIVETDGHISWAAVLNSSGTSGFDDAAVKWMSSAHFKFPAYLNGTAVRAFSFTNFDFVRRSSESSPRPPY